MEDFDVFTNEINFTKTVYKNIVTRYANDIPSTPSGPNYQSSRMADTFKNLFLKCKQNIELVKSVPSLTGSRKLVAEECLAEDKEIEAAFHLSESVSVSLRTLAMYRDEQLKSADNKMQKITSLSNSVRELIEKNPLSNEDSEMLSFIPDINEDVSEKLKKLSVNEELPFYKKYMRFGPHNNIENMCKILEEFPKEWTIIQLTAPYNPNENLKPLAEYRTEINALYLTMFSNDYLDVDVGPITVNVPANVTKEGEKPLFTELYSLLEENYKTIDNAQFLNNKRLVQNYWSKREDIDLRIKSVINVMDKHWLGGFGTMLTGKLRDCALRDRVVRLVDAALRDWGFMKLTKKQKILLYNLIDSCQSLSSQQIKSCIRRILTEHGKVDETRKVLKRVGCDSCDKDFMFATDLCFKCLSKCFEEIHHFSLVDGIRAFSQVANQVRDGDEWSGLKKAKRYPVILIVDEILDTFPWESLPILNQQGVCRIENIHFLYALYKIHEKDIVDGYFTTTGEVGRYIINPERNLERMEVRMRAFVQYWCSGWVGECGRAPPPDAFLRDLAEADFLLYCGHGDGCGLAGAGGGGAVERARARAACVLAGCGSARLQPPPGRAPPAAAHHHLHVAGCPLVVGMLWEVTDLEVDKLVSSFLSLCVPSTAPLPWASVGKAKWSQGQLDTSAAGAAGAVGAAGAEAEGRARGGGDALEALAAARGASAFAAIAASAVARGLPLACPSAPKHP